MKETWFQSLSGLTLGLNIIRVARAATEKDEFQSLSGLTLGLNSLPFFPCKINNLNTHFREPIWFRLFSSPIQHAPRKIETGNFF